MLTKMIIMIKPINRSNTIDDNDVNYSINRNNTGAALADDDAFYAVKR